VRLHEEPMTKRKATFSLMGMGLAAMIGVFLGSGAFTFHYGEGWSYFSEDPTSCINCHIMQIHYDTWHHSSHSAVATCADCHLPQDFPHSYISKADNGFFHSWEFTFQAFHEPIQIKPRNQRILENNCIRCHSNLVDQMMTFHVPADRAGATSCLHCHSEVGHTNRPRMTARGQ
jgi:cytochrome c nitrite reductase small subunit